MQRFVHRVACQQPATRPSCHAANAGADGSDATLRRHAAACVSAAGLCAVRQRLGTVERVEGAPAQLEKSGWCGLWTSSQHSTNLNESSEQLDATFIIVI